MDFHKKRESWTDTETHQMLLIIKRNYISKLVNNACYRNLQIFEEISREMAKLNYKKNALQIRIKFKSLKLDYKKLIQNAGNYSDSVRRHTMQHINLLNAIFERSDTNVNESPETIEEETMPVLSDPLDVTYHEREIKKEQDEENEINNEDEMTDEINPEATLTTEDEASGADENLQTPLLSTELDTEKQDADIAATATAPIKTFKQQKRQSYHNVVENFTREWKNSQLTLMQTMEQQDQKYLHTLEAQCKRQEAILREDRKEMERILKQDREEMKTFFTSVLQSMGVPIPNMPECTKIEYDDMP